MNASEIFFDGIYRLILEDEVFQKELKQFEKSRIVI